MSTTFAVRDIIDDDMEPGPYDSLEGDTVFATWFDLCPVMGSFQSPLFSDDFTWAEKRALTY